MMVRNARLVLCATAAVTLTTAAAQAGSVNAYGESAAPSVSSYTAGTSAAPQAQPYYDPAPVQAPIANARDGYYDESKGNNQDFDYQQSHACGGALDGAKCLVILNDHMRRVRLDRVAGTILVGNPTIADVTVLGNDTMFVSARSIGSTNIIALDTAGNEIATYEVFVREPSTKRVVLRNGGAVAHFQCAPNCERALTQSDSPNEHGSRLSVVSADMGLDSQSIGLQSGMNPNTQGPAAQAAAGAGAGLAPSSPAAGLASGVQDLGASIAPAMGAIQSIQSMMGAGAPRGPVNSSAPPIQPN